MGRIHVRSSISATWGALMQDPLFLFQGMDVIFRIGIAILQTSQNDLLSKDMELMLQFFQKEISAKFEADEESFFNAAYQVRFNAKKLKR